MMPKRCIEETLAATRKHEVLETARIEIFGRNSAKNQKFQDYQIEIIPPEDLLNILI